MSLRLSSNVQEGCNSLSSTIGRLRHLILNEGVPRVLPEAYLNGVPEWQLRQDTTDYVDQIRDRIKRYILLNKSQNSSDQREAIAAMNDVCDELEKKLYDQLETSLFDFTRRV